MSLERCNEGSTKPVQPFLVMLCLMSRDFAASAIKPVLIDHQLYAMWHGAPRGLLQSVEGARSASKVAVLPAAGVLPTAAGARGVTVLELNACAGAASWFHRVCSRTMR